MTPEAATAIVEGEIQSLREAAARYSTLRRPEEAAKLRRQVEALVSLS